MKNLLESQLQTFVFPIMLGRRNPLAFGHHPSVWHTKRTKFELQIRTFTLRLCQNAAEIGGTCKRSSCPVSNAC